MLDKITQGLELAHGVFRADQTALILGDLGLPSRYDALVKEHAEFFAAKTRKDRAAASIIWPRFCVTCVIRITRTAIWRTSP